MPKDLKTSVFGIDGLIDKDIWAIGEAVIAASGRTLHGRGDLNSTTVIDSGLSLDFNNTPHRHVDIVGWPPDELLQRQSALKLADNCVLKLLP